MSGKKKRYSEMPGNSRCKQSASNRDIMESTGTIAEGSSNPVMETTPDLTCMTVVRSGCLLTNAHIVEPRWPDPPSFFVAL